MKKHLSKLSFKINKIRNNENIADDIISEGLEKRK